MFNKSKPSENNALNSSNEITSDKSVLGQNPKGRPVRVPLSQQFRLTVPTGIKKDGYEYRYIRDSAERVEAFQAAYWEPVHDGIGKPIRKASGDSYLLLYRIEEEYYLEDLKAKEKLPINLLVEQAKLKKGDGEYIPEGQEGVVVINK